MQCAFYYCDKYLVFEIRMSFTSTGIFFHFAGKSLHILKKTINLSFNSLLLCHPSETQLIDAFFSWDEVLNISFDKFIRLQRSLSLSLCSSKNSEFSISFFWLERNSMWSFSEKKEHAIWQKSCQIERETGRADIGGKNHQSTTTTQKQKQPSLSHVWQITTDYNVFALVFYR